MMVAELINECRCRACEHGCRYGSGIMVGDDIKQMSKLLGVSEKELKEKYLEETEQYNRVFLRPRVLRGKKPYGRCIFFRNGCLIHRVKPLQCKIATGCRDGEKAMRWFVENYLVDFSDPVSKKMYEIAVGVR